MREEPRLGRDHHTTACKGSWTEVSVMNLLGLPPAGQGHAQVLIGHDDQTGKGQRVTCLPSGFQGKGWLLVLPLGRAKSPPPA